MVRYANYQICIFMNINENIRNKRKISKKLRGFTCQIFYISAAYFPRLPDYVAMGLSAVCDCGIS